MPRILCSILAAAPALVCQCNQPIVPGNGLPATGSAFYSIALWDPDGAGPAAEELVACGDSAFGTTSTIFNVGSYSFATATWIDRRANLAAISPAITNIADVAVLANGELVIAARESSPYRRARLLRWNGNGWTQFGLSAIGGWAFDLVPMPNGDLVVTGDFSSMQGVPGTNALARWNGTAWSSLATTQLDQVWFGTAAPNGDLIVAAPFTQIGGVAANKVARWNGSTWSPLGTGLQGQPGASWPSTLLTLPNGDLVVGGLFDTAGGVPCNGVARWNGSGWSPLGSGLTSTTGYLPVFDIVALANGDLVASGQFTAPGGVANLARWNGQAWLPLGGGVAGVLQMAVTPAGELYGGGTFDTIGGLSTRGLCRLSNAAATGLSGGSNGSIAALLALTNGDQIAAGSFTAIGGVPSNRIAQWDGSRWRPLGTGLDGPVLAVARTPSGDLLVGGDFDTAGGQPIRNLARWNGQAWSAVGDPDDSVVCLLTLANGETAIGGRFVNAAGQTLNGTAVLGVNGLRPLGGGVVDTQVLAQLPNGDLVAGSALGGALRRFDGVSWSNLAGSPVGIASALLTTRDGALVVTGAFGGQFAARFDGSIWTTLAGLGGTAAALLELPNGDLLAGSPSIGGAGARLRRWNGASWGNYGPELRATSGTAEVLDLLRRDSGEIVVGGSFATAAPATFAANLQRLLPTCPASVTADGGGCTGSAGAVLLTVAERAWLGGRVRTATTGLPANGVAVAVWGFAPLATPLASVLPQGLPSCTLRVDPVLLTTLPIAQGRSEATLGIPVSASLLNTVVRHQLVGIELGASAVIIEATTSDAVALTIGAQ